MEAKTPINKTLYRSYRGELSKLTFNSKPIINDLSKLATANVNDAETILKAIEDHLRFSVPNLKLPAFYLLDSIVKNVGGMYMDLLYGRLERIFVDVWKTVDAEVRAKMERTLRTWRDGFDGGPKNLFPEFVLRKIEEDVAKLKARATGNVAVAPVAEGGVDILDNLTSMQSYAKKRAQEERKQSIEQAASARAGAYDAANGSNGRPLHPPKRQRTPDRAQGVINQGLLQEVYKVIKKKQVEMLRRPNDIVLFGVMSKLNSIKDYVTAASDLPRYRINEIRDQLVHLESDVVEPPVQALRDVSLESSDANQLLSSLMARPDLVNSLAKVAPELSTSLGALMAPAQQSGAELGAPSLAELIPMTQVSIARKRAGMHNALYQGGYPRQCSQCGWRGQDSDEGKARMNAHLDWHFRRNLRTQGEQVRKAPMRGWYVEQGAWEAPMVAEAEVSEEKVNKEIEPMEEVTVAATDNNEPCAVCRESFERKFIEEDEAWVLVNAMRVGDKLYHATCQHPVG
ncbi:mRNA 3' end processing factor [Coemansia spiralis]|uniref:mRNA 3' end processing factor n=1 Tax=Coemansia spiralis TaxID=417178 RepID=A0A9W8GJK4_9FUNG|nr:mRNA 3' end processing factor [Coemansia spiralis]